MVGNSMQSGAEPAGGSGKPERAKVGTLLLGRYELTRLLGESAIGWVFAARDTSDKFVEHSAVTVLRPEHAAPGSLVRNLAQREIAIRRRVRNEDWRAGLARPNEVEVREEEGLVFLVSELVDGPSLDELALSQGPLAPEEIRMLGRSIARTLAALHACGYACGDLRSSAIRLRKGVEPVLLDLGIAKRAAGRRSSDGRALAQEERERGSTTTAAADVFRLGLLLEELSSRPGAPVSTPYRTAEGAPNRHAAPPDSPPESDLEACIRACLEHDPRRRPTALDVAKALRSRPDPKRLRRGLTAIGLALLAGSMAVTAWARRPVPPPPRPAARAVSSAVKAMIERLPIPPMPATPPSGTHARPPVPDPAVEVAPVKFSVDQPITAAFARASLVVENASGQLSLWDGSMRGELALARHPATIDGIPHLRSVASSRSRSLAVDGEGHLWTWTDPSNAHRISNFSGVLAVAMNNSVAVLLQEDGSLVAYRFEAIRVPGGAVTPPMEPFRDFSGQAPLPMPGTGEVQAIAAEGNSVFALRRDGTVWSWGESAFAPAPGKAISPPTQIAGLSQIVAISCGSEHGMALDKAGSLWTWGDNSYLQRGLPLAPGALDKPSRIASLPVLKAISAGRNSGLALDTKGGVWEWGSRFSNYRTMSDRSPVRGTLPRKVAGLPPAKLIATSGGYSVAVSDTNALWAWGRIDTENHW